MGLIADENIAERAGLDLGAVRYSLRALTPNLVTIRKDGSGRVFVVSVHDAARRATGQWPSPEQLADRVITGLAEAPGAEPDPEKKGMLRTVAEALGGAGREVAVEVVAEILRGAMGLG